VLRRRVALKVNCARHLQGDAGSVARFFAEARATSELRHPHIVEVHDFGELPDGGPTSPWSGSTG